MFAHPETEHSLRAVLAILRNMPQSAERDAAIAEMVWVIEQETGTPAGH